MRVDSEGKKKAGKKTLSFAVCLAMVLTMLPAGSSTAWADGPPGYDQAAFGTVTAAAEKGGAADSIYTIDADTKSSIPMGVHGTDEFAGGDGSENEPYLIENWTHLDNVRDYLDAYFELSADLDETTAGYDTLASASANGGSGWNPIGTTGSPFTGTLDSNGKTITGLRINRPSTDYIGLFGSTGSNSVIKNMGLLDVGITGRQYIGGLAGYSRGEITNCSSAGTVTGGSLTLGAYSGGLVGENDGLITGSHATGTVNARGMAAGGLAGTNNGTITNCYAAGTVNCNGSEVGGLVGWSPYGSSIIDSYSAVDVDGAEDVGGLVGYSVGEITGSHATGAVNARSPNAGGLVGYSSGSIIANSYATGAVTGTSYVGGLVGYNNYCTIEKTYAAGKVTGNSNVGGLVGRNSGGTVTGSFYNRQTTGRVDTGKGEPKTSAEMVQQATFTARSWNFDAGSGIWMISEGASYPYLREFTPVSLPSPPALTGVTVTPSALTLTYGGGPTALAAVETPAGALYDVSWSSSDEDVVMVNESGVVTPVGAGTATISAVTDAGGFTGSTTVTINKKTLTVGGTLTAIGKTYDGTTAAAINAAGLTLAGIIAGDTGQVTLNAAAAFEDANAGTGRTVRLTGVSSLEGDKAGNYTLSLDSAPTSSAMITARGLTVGGSFTANDKPYDGTTAASINTNDLTLPDVLEGDAGQVALNAILAFADADAGEGKNVSLTEASSLEGDKAGNYTLSLDSAPTSSAMITARGLTVGGSFTANDKPYDGTTAASINTNDLTLLDVLAGDTGQVALNAAAAFDSADAGTGKTVSLTNASSLGGGRAGNYTLSLDGAPTTMAAITKRPITITADVKSKTVGEADHALTYRITEGELIGEDTLTGALSRTAGEAIGSYIINIGTLDAGLNYEIIYHEATFTINRAPSGHKDKGNDSSIPDSYTFEIPEDFLSGKSEISTLPFNCSIADITVPQDMLLNIPGEENKKTEITIGQGDKSKLPDDIKAAIGDRLLISLSQGGNGPGAVQSVGKIARRRCPPPITSF